MKQLKLFILFSFFSVFANAQTDQEIYDQAFEKVNCMLLETCSASFKDAVFTVENAYFSNQLDKENFDKRILFLTQLSKSLMANRELIYDLSDKEEVKKCAAIFTVIADTIPVQIDSGKIAYIYPYTYDFNDIWGDKEWSNMFVAKLLETKTGNCHSLPYLYKILANEIGVKAHIAVAPNHFYIKHQNKGNGWFNTELTSGIFPVDAWLMASGYIHLDAVVNKLYMEALSEKQMLALNLIDLAKGYERKLGVHAKSDFILKCCETALKYYPNYINALILKAETKKKIFDALMVKYNAQNPADIFIYPEAQQIFTEMTVLYAQIHELGYRKMPEEMYLNWLVSLKEERSKYENKNISNFKPKSN
ncbi:MAG: hypothetical protein QY303_00860 [Vicingaceae bacterium]|nr:MAG: hypothetical protein QY303_00860 [Vicingaceae bacterium]